MTLLPAYGRDYKSRAAVLVDLKAGKDFLLYAWGNVYDRKPINLPEILAHGGVVTVRYSAGRKVVVFKRSELE